MTPTTAPFATHNRRVQRTTAETPHPQHLFVSRLSPPAARRLSLPHFHADKQPGRGLYSACRAYCAPRESRTGPIPASFTSPTSLPRSPAGPAQAAFGVKHRHFLAQFLARKQESGRPARLFFGRVAERQQTPNHGTSRCGKATADSVNSDPLTHLPKRHLRTICYGLSRRRNAAETLTLTLTATATDARHAGNRPPSTPRAPDSNRLGLGHDADDHAIFLFSPVSAFATDSFANCPPPPSHAAPCPSSRCSPSSHGLAAPAILQPRPSLRRPPLIDTTCPAFDHDRSLLLAWPPLTNAPSPIHVPRRR